MSRQEIRALFIGLLLAAFLIWGIGFAFADPQTLELPVPTPTATPFAVHYRCSVARDGTTVTLKPIEGGPKIHLSCLNCLCSGAIK